MIIHVIVVFRIPRQEQGQPLGHSSATHTLTCDLPVPCYADCIIKSLAVHTQV